MTQVIVTSKSRFLILDDNNYYVGGSGPNNYTKIQDAVNDSNDGDTVFVYNGIYYEHIKIDKDINLIVEEKQKKFLMSNDLTLQLTYVDM